MTSLRRTFMALIGAALCVGAAFAASPAAAGQAAQGASLHSSDSALIRHLWRNDKLFTRVFEKCRNVSITPAPMASRREFTFRGECEIRRPPEESDDCGWYRVEAKGTVDHAQWASVRRWSLELLCTA